MTPIDRPYKMIHRLGDVIGHAEFTTSPAHATTTTTTTTTKTTTTTTTTGVDQEGGVVELYIKMGC